MKKVLVSVALLCCLALCSCAREASSIGIIGGADGPTKIFVSDN